jgi:hypothetical protein
MNLNPEFKRNLLLQLSLQRLLIAPLAIGAVSLLAWITADHSAKTLEQVARFLFSVVVLLWGTRRAADALAEEVSGGTWDSQRMSALGAWQMAWGKFFGGTAYVWYCGAICLGVWLAASLQLQAGAAAIRDALYMAGDGLFAQVVAFAASLMFLQKQPLSRRLPVTFCQILGIGAGLLMQNEPGRIAERWFESAPVDWYGLQLEPAIFHLLSLAAFAGWALLGSYRLMRAELQFRTWPWAWLAFAAFVMIYGEGFPHAFLATSTGTGLTLLVPLILGVVLLYAALFGETKDVVRYRWTLRALRGGDWRRAFALLPLWIPTYVVVAAIAVLAAVRVEPGSLIGTFLGDLQNVGILPTPAIFLALLLLLARDIALVLALNFGRVSRRADLAAFIYLVVLYGPLPGIVVALGLRPLASIFYPASMGSALLTLGPPAIEAVAMIALLAVRWRAANRSIRPPAVETQAAVAS